MVVEGVSTCRAAYELSRELGVDMPITETLYGVLYEGEQIAQGLKQLMARVGKREVSLDYHE